MRVGRPSWARWLKCGVLGGLSLLLASCGFMQQRSAPVQQSSMSAAGPRTTGDRAGEPLSHYGNPEFYDVMGTRYFPAKSARGYRERGIASWYGPDFHGGLTSTREYYDMYKMTAAHKVLPLPTWVEVVNLQNGRKVKVRVNDRGPFKDNRIIDLSYAAALSLDIVGPGTAFVEVRALDTPTPMLDTPAPIHAPGLESVSPVPTLRTPAGSGRTMVTVATPSVPPSPTQPKKTTDAHVGLYLQVGAFGEQTNAERLKTRLDAKFHDEVRIFSEPPGAPRLYKVELGPIKDVAQADQLTARLSSVGINNHHFVNN